MKKAAKTVIPLALIILLAFGIFHWGTNMLISKLHYDLGSRNWRIELDHGYTIQQTSGNNIVLTKENSSTPTEITISSHITSFSYSEQFAGFLCSDVSATAENQKKYYILDMEKETLYGPFQTDAYHSFCDEYKINLSEWINTTPRPELATFN